MNDIPQLTVAYALNDGKSAGPVYDTESKARRQPAYLRDGAPVLRLYIDPDGRIVHTEEIPDGPQE